MQRMGFVLGLKADRVEAYKRLHAAVWPDMLDLLGRHGIRNFSIYLREPENLIFSCFEYHGTDYAEDQRKLAAEPVAARWAAVVAECQQPLATRAEGEWWAGMEEIFHMD